VLVWNTEYETFVPTVSNVTISGCFKNLEKHPCNKTVLESVGVVNSSWAYHGSFKNILDVRLRWKQSFICMTMCTRVWFNCGVVCTHEKNKFVKAITISDKLKLRFCKKSTKIIVKVQTHRTRFDNATRFFNFHCPITLLLV
jgi:hypothetical protein